MRRPTRSKLGQSDPDNNPDFYRLSLVRPLPDGESNNPELAASIPGTGPELLKLSARNHAAARNINSADGHRLSHLHQGILTQNMNQLSPGMQSNLPITPNVVSSSHLGAAGGNPNIDMGQLSALRARREELLRQLQTLQTQEAQTIHDIEASSLLNSARQNPRIGSLGLENVAGQMGQRLLLSDLGMTGSSHLGMLGNERSSLSGLNHQLLMQQNLLGMSNGGLGGNGMASSSMLGASGMGMGGFGYGLGLGSSLNQYDAMLRNQSDPNRPYMPGFQRQL